MFSTTTRVNRTIEGVEYRNIHLTVSMSFHGRLPSDVTATVQREVVSNRGNVVFEAGEEIELTAAEEDSISQRAPQAHAPRKGNRRERPIIFCDVR